MRLFLTGDTHADPKRLISFAGLMSDELTRDDFLIICGDSGFIWYKPSVDDPEISRIFDNFPCTVLWVDGNHENFTQLERYPVMDWKGGKVRVTGDNFLHLMRGEVFDLDGITFLTFGGAMSIDRGPINGHFAYWWPQEIPNLTEFENAKKNLARHNNKVDYIITHEAPPFVVQTMFGYKSISDYDFQKFLLSLSLDIDFEHWYFGHHHEEQNYDRFSCLYQSIIEVPLKQ